MVIRQTTRMLKYLFCFMSLFGKKYTTFLLALVLELELVLCQGQHSLRTGSWLGLL